MCCRGMKQGGIIRAALAARCRTAPEREQADSATVPVSGSEQETGSAKAQPRDGADRTGIPPIKKSIVSKIQ